MMRYWVVALGLALLLTLLPFHVLALQEEDPLPVTPGAGRFLPSAQDLGPDWVEVWQSGLDPGADLFKEGAVTVYGGSAGSRAVVYAWVIQDSTTAVRRSWEETVDLLNDQRYEWASDYDWSQADVIDRLPAPDGCVEASRAEGGNPDSQYPAGLTLCAIDPDVIVLAIVSGELEGETGYLSSDLLIQKALRAGAS
jgi:hypothetical protein